MTKILLRFDDICPTMNWRQWDDAKSLMDSLGVKALIGVIPDCRDQDLMIDEPRVDFWNYIKELQQQGFSIAMHGYQHVFDINAKGLVTPVKHSEFAGHPYEVQYEKIKKGKTILIAHGIETDIFFAPAHSYDDNTLKALAANGFRYISDGESSKPYKRKGIVCIPARSGGFSLLRFLNYHTIVLHAHEWVRQEKKGEKAGLITLLNNKKIQFLTFYEFANRERGYPFFQRNTEVFNLFVKQTIIPILVKIKHIFK